MQPLASSDFSEAFKDEQDEKSKKYFIEYVESFQSKDELWEMLHGVNFLNIPPLIDLLAAKVATEMYGKSS